MGDQMVTLSDGRVMTLSQYRAMVDQAVSRYTSQMTVAVEQLTSLQDQVYARAGEVYSTLYTLQSDLSGLDAAIGTDEQGQKFRKAWKQAWPQLEQAISGVAQALDQVGGGLGSAADTVFQAEEQTLAGFDRMGFDFHAVDPRWRPAPRSGRGPF